MAVCEPQVQRRLTCKSPWIDRVFLSHQTVLVVLQCGAITASGTARWFLIPLGFLKLCLASEILVFPSSWDPVSFAACGSGTSGFGLAAGGGACPSLPRLLCHRGGPALGPRCALPGPVLERGPRGGRCLWASPGAVAGPGFRVPARFPFPGPSLLFEGVAPRARSALRTQVPSPGQRALCPEHLR